MTRLNDCPRSYLYLTRKVVAAQKNPTAQETENNIGRAKGISCNIMSIFMSMSAANCSGPLLDSPMKSLLHHKGNLGEAGLISQWGRST